MISLERKIFGGLGAALVLVLCVAGIAAWTTSQFIEAYGWVQHTHEVLDVLDEIEALMERTQSDQRSYLLTSDDSYLEEIRREKALLNGALVRLDSLLAGNAQRRRRGAELKADVDSKLRRMDDGISARRNRGLKAAAGVVSEGSGRLAMERFRTAIADLKATESALLAERRSAVDRQARRAWGAIILLCAGGLLLALAASGAIWRDLAGRKEAEKKVLRLNAELEKRVRQLDEANQALESFASAVSHDLRAPLRRMEGFSQALLEEYAGALDARGKDYLSRVQKASGQMNQLIDDLLGLARISRAEIKNEPVDLSALARSICAQLQASDPKRQADFEIQPGLRARGDPGLLSVALENLLGNAWKFSAKAAPARIKFGTQTERGETAYFVADNGAGFDMAYASGLFKPFRRLHKQSEFAGTGVGLATVRRIIERHGGRIWARSRPGEGAAFYFTIGGVMSSSPQREPVEVPLDRETHWMGPGAAWRGIFRR